ncbi:MAG: hypothetical protein B9S33_11405 [Pedosphaera sp. Tous-C6FEB]|nr:MAG: hypothetical protein B9S33_11405 [Pedosphaera sp. Tous-C6FEB]
MAKSSQLLLVRVPSLHLRSAIRWLAVVALVFHIAWLPVHLLTEAHCDTGPAHNHAQAHAAHHGHDHDHGDGADDASHHQHDDDSDHHHFAGDHGSKFLAKRQAVLFAPLLVAWQTALVTPPSAVMRELPAQADPSPPPADFSPPSGPRAPPLA